MMCLSSTSDHSSITSSWVVLSINGQHPGHLVVDVLPLDQPSQAADQDCKILGNDNAVCSSDTITFDDNRDNNLIVSQSSDDVEDEDPMLEEMPGYNFKAYKRADVSSFYNEPPGSREEMTLTFQGQAAKFQNMSPEQLDLIWDDGSGAANGNHICSTQPFSSCGTSSFETHVFHFVRPSTKEVVCTFHVVKQHSVYYCDPFVANDPADRSAGILHEDVKSVDILNNDAKQLYEAAQFNREFAPVYKNFTGGSEWLSQFPTQKPRHFMWRADYFGQEHHVSTKETHFVSLPPAGHLHKLSTTDMKRENVTAVPLRQWRDGAEELNLTLTVVSVAPRYENSCMMCSCLFSSFDSKLTCFSFLHCQNYSN
jgi:hypothetical protein